MEHNEKLLDEAEPTDPRGGVEPPGPGQDGPGDPLGPALVLQFPHVGGQRGLVLLVPKRLNNRHICLFERHSAK